MDPKFALVAAVVVVVVLYIAASRNPLTKCRRCGGRGQIRSWVLPWRFRVCPRCGGGRQVRGRFARN